MSQIASLRDPISKITIAVLAAILLLAGYPAASQIVGQPTVAPPPERTTLDRNNVDVTSGALSLSFNELSIGSGSQGLQLVSMYNSSSGWRHSLLGVLEMRTFGEWNGDIAITASWANQSWVFGDVEGYSRAGDGAYLTSTTGGEFIVTLRDGTVLTYSHLTAGYELGCPGDGSMDCYRFYFATSIVYPNGLVVTPHYRVYPGTQGLWAVRVQSVTNNAGYQIKFNYQSNTVTSSTRGPFLTRTSAVALNNAVEYCDPTADTCSLSGNWPTVTYGNAAGTHTVTDSLSRATQFSYSSTSFRIRTPGSPSDNIQYTLSSFVIDAHGTNVRRVTSATLGSSTWSYGYVQNSNTNPTMLTVTSTDPLNRQTIYISNKYTFPTNFFGEWSAWGLTSMKDPLNRTTTFSYPCTDGAHFNGASYKVTSPEQNATTPACDTRGNITSVTTQAKPGSGLPNIVTSATFPPSCSNSKTCNQPIESFDGRLARTDYTYDPTHGGVLTETQPAVSVCAPAGTPCAAVRPKKIYGYDQFHAYVRNSSGALVQAASPVWLPTRVAECRTSASCASSADEVVTTFEYGAPGTVNRLLVRGKVVTSGGVSLRTCYSYDRLGNQISATSPRAGLSVCP